jgi:hypothetical protein
MSGTADEFDAATVCRVVCAEIARTVSSNPQMRAELAAPFLTPTKVGGPRALLYAIRIDSLDDARHFLLESTAKDYVERMLITDHHPSAIQMMSSAAAPPLCNMKPAYDHRAGLQMAFRVEVRKETAAKAVSYVAAAFAMGLTAKYDPVYDDKDA